MKKLNNLFNKFLKAHGKPRYYYFRLSYMSKQKEGTLIYADATAQDDSGSEHFPLMDAIMYAQKYFKDCAHIETIQICNYMEIAKRDYDDFNDFRKLKEYLKKKGA